MSQPQGNISYSTTFDYRLGTKTGKDVWGYGSFTIPDWVQNALAVILLMILAGSFGALHSGLGSIITGIFALIFWSKGWLDTLGAGAAFLGGLVVIMGIYYLRKHQAVRG